MKLTTIDYTQAARAGGVPYGSLQPGDRFRFLMEQEPMVKGKGGWYTVEVTGRKRRTGSTTIVVPLKGDPLHAVLTAEEIALVKLRLSELSDWRNAVRGMHNGRVPCGCRDIVTPVRIVRNRLSSDPNIFARLMEVEAM